MERDGKYPRILPAGDSCVIAEFGSVIDMGINRRVTALERRVRNARFPGFLDAVPTYRSLAVCFDPAKTDVEGLYEVLGKMCRMEEQDQEQLLKRTLVVPTLYGGEWGPDLEDVAAHAGIPPDEAVRRHTGRDYYCYMLGFPPGFAYLGGMDESLATPRLKDPRQEIPAGSVGIAGSQTGFYSIASPGGWRLIGRTPIPMFDPRRDPAVFLEAGMWVRFRSIGRERFDEIRDESARGSFSPEILEEKVEEA